MVTSASGRAVLERQGVIGDAVVGDEILREIEVLYPRRNEATLIDGVEPFPEVDDVIDSSAGLTVARILLLGVQQAADDSLEGRVVHLRGHRADDSTGSCILRRDDLFNVGWSAGSNDLPVGQIERVRKYRLARMFSALRMASSVSRSTPVRAASTR